LEILVGDAFGRVVLQAHLDPGIGGGDVGMVPGGLGEMADGVDHHQRALPAMRLVLAPDPAVLVPPMWQLAGEPRLGLVLGIGAFALLRLGHGFLQSSAGGFVSTSYLVYRNAMPTQSLDPTSDVLAAVEILAPARLHLGFLDL